MPSKSFPEASKLHLASQAGANYLTVLCASVAKPNTKVHRYLPKASQMLLRLLVEALHVPAAFTYCLWTAQGWVLGFTVGSQTLARAIGSPQMLARFLPGDDQMLPVWVVVVRGWRMGRHHTAFRHAGNRTPGTHAGLVDASHGQPGLTRMHAFPMAHRLFSGGLSLAPQAPNSFGVHTPIATTDYQVHPERWRIQDALVAVGMSHRCAVAGSAHQHGTSRCLGLMPVCRSEVSKDLFATTTDTCIYMRSCHRSIRNMFCDFGQSSCQRGRPWIGSPMKHIDEVIGNPGSYYVLCYSVDSHAH